MVSVCWAELYNVIYPIAQSAVCPCYFNPFQEVFALACVLKCSYGCPQQFQTSFALVSHLIKSEMKKKKQPKTQYQNTYVFRKPEETVFVASGTRG